jgi:Spy/CpxP family protein refolding chaperone
MILNRFRGHSLAWMAAVATVATLMSGAVAAVHALPQEAQEAQEAQETQEAQAAREEQQARLEAAKKAHVEALASMEAAKAHAKGLYQEALEAAQLATKEAWAENEAAMQESAEAAKEAMVRLRRIAPQVRLQIAREMQERARAPRAAHGRAFFRGGSAADRVLAMSEQLELTEEQQERIREVRREHRREQIERDAQIELTSLDLREMMEDMDTADLGAIEGVMQRRAELRVQAEMANLRLRRHVREVLTEEQREMMPSRQRGMLMLRGEAPHAFMHDSEVMLEALGDWDWEGNFDFEFDGDMFELHGEDAGPRIWRYRLHKDDDEGDDEEVSTEGTAVGEALSSYTPIRISL